MSNKKWGNATHNNKSQEQQQARDEEDEEFGEFEGFEGAGHFEPSMAQPLPQALQAGMSAWSTFPDYVPSQRTASSALQPDLLPTQATSNMHNSQMTDSNSSLGEAVSFDMPDVSPPQEHPPAPPGGGPSPGPASMPSAEGSSAGASAPRSHNASHSSPLALALLPDVSSRPEVKAVPDVRANVTGAIARSRISGVTAEGVGGASSSTQANGVGGSPQAAYLEEQLSNSRILSQRLTSETEDLQKRVNDLEDQLSRCRGHLHVQKKAEANLEAVVQSALQRQRSEFAAEIQGQISRLHRAAVNTNATTGISEERLLTLLSENNKRQLTEIEGRLDAFAEKLTESVRSIVRTAVQSAPENVAAASNLEEVLRKFGDEQQQRDADTRAHTLSCLESVLECGHQQLKVLLLKPKPPSDPNKNS